MQITDNHIDEVSLAALGTEANCLLCSGNIPTLVERFGYARAFNREPATAIRENLASCLAELRTTNLESIGETPKREPPSTRLRRITMDEFDSLSHSKWECKYHIVFIPKCRRRTLYEQLRQHLGEVFRRLAEHKESRIEEGRLMPDHVHMMISIPPKYAVSQVVGYMKGKSAIHLARVYGERKRSFVGQSFWARGYFVSTVGRDEETIREYIRHQEHEDKRLDQMNLWR